MAEDPDNLVLVHLRRLDAKLDRVLATLDDHTQRLLRLERRLHERDGDALRQDEAVARLDLRLVRVERRLDLVDPSLDPPPAA